MKTNQLQFIPKRFIVELGAEAAFVLTKLCVLQVNATSIVAGKRWFSCPTGRRSARKDALNHYRPLQDHIPWRSAKQIHKIITSPANTKSTRKIKSKRRDTSLEKAEYVEIGRGLNSENWNKTLWFHVPDKAIRKGFLINRLDGKVRLSAKPDAVWFNDDDATKLGSVARAIVKNIIEREFHLLGNGEVYLNLNRNAISGETGLPLSTISDIIAEFVESKSLAVRVNLSKMRKVKWDEEPKLQQPKFHTNNYMLLTPNPCTMKSRGEGRKAVASVVGVPIIEGSCDVNPHAVAIVNQTDNPGIGSLTGEVMAEMAQWAKEKTKKRIRKRRRGKLSDADKEVEKTDKMIRYKYPTEEELQRIETNSKIKKYWEGVRTKDAVEDDVPRPITNPHARRLPVPALREAVLNA